MALLFSLPKKGFYSWVQDAQADIQNNRRRGGGGITYRRSFNNFYEFLHSPKKITDFLPSTAMEKNGDSKRDGKVAE